MHVGPYDALGETYERMAEWMRAQAIMPGDVMWESYLTEPRTDDPEATRTSITWSIA